MGLAGRILGGWGGAPTPGEGDLARDIDQELAFHLEAREQELVQSGLSPEQARAEALRRFGSLEHIRAECRRIQSGGRIMLQKITLVALVALVSVLALFSYQLVVSQHAAQRELEAMRAQVQLLMERTERAATVNQAEQNRILLPGGEAPVLGQLPLISRYFAGQQREPDYSEEATPTETWLSRFSVTGSADTQAALGQVESWATSLAQRCTPERRMAVANELWRKWTPATRLAVLGAFVDGNSEAAAREAVHLAAMDSDETVAARGFELLRELTFMDFDRESRIAYMVWYEANKEKDLSEITAERAPLLVAALSSAEDWDETCARYSRLWLHRNLPAVHSVPEHLRAAGALNLVQKWARSDDPRARQAAVQWLGVLEIDEVTARVLMLPLLSDTRPRAPGFLAAACESLRSMEASWTWEPLLAELGRVLGEPEIDRDALTVVARALSEQPSDRTLPVVLAWILEVDSPTACEILGRETLPSLTGVDYDAFHDATWWSNWWSINGAEWGLRADTANGLPEVGR
ncbi:MAG: hypothetical protein IPK67_19055 [Planctomycetes bacterium]|nr:hypothetical protein [Planctomycetota bacterium]